MAHTKEKEDQVAKVISRLETSTTGTIVPARSVGSDGIFDATFVELVRRARARKIVLKHELKKREDHLDSLQNDRRRIKTEIRRIDCLLDASDADEDDEDKY